MGNQCKMTGKDVAEGRPWPRKSKSKAGQMNDKHLFGLVIAWIVCLLAVCVQPVEAIVAGSATESPVDSPSNRIIDNSDTNSPFAGVGSIDGLPVGRGTATPLSRWHILTAAHIVDPNGDTVADADPGTFSFNLNYGSDYSSVHPGLDITVHPDWTGFNNPSVNDDLAIMTLSTPIPAGVPFYGLYGRELRVDKTLDFVGYGQSGYGDVGYTTGASWTVKRWGQNEIGSRQGGDDSGDSGYELWQGDFDGPSGDGLGNDVETTFGIGDSGGPAFYYKSNQYQLAGINTFVSFVPGNAGKFGSGLGGILIEPYLSWIKTVLAAPILLPGDVNGNLFVSQEDLTIIINNWGLSGASREQGDLNGNGIVDGPDYSEVISYWGNGIPTEPSEPPAAIAAMPEPATVWLMILAGAILARRKKKQ